MISCEISGYLLLARSPGGRDRTGPPRNNALLASAGTAYRLRISVARVAPDASLRVGRAKIRAQSENILLRFFVMNESISFKVAEMVRTLPERSFVRACHIDAPRGPVGTALSRTCASGELMRVRQGLYWKGAPTRFGMSRPSVVETALEVGGPGSGPAGVAAAYWLGLTTQVPATFVTAVPVRAPAGWSTVRFCQRTFGRRLRVLRPSEVATIEVLRAGPTVVEGPWLALAARAESLADSHELRLSVLAEQIADEPHVLTRQRWRDLVDASPLLEAGIAT